MGSFAGLLKSLNKGWLKDILVGAGLTLGTAGASMLIINQFITSFKDNINTIPVDVLSLAHMAGFDYGFSIILGAIVASAMKDATKLSLRKK